MPFLQKSLVVFFDDFQRAAYLLRAEAIIPGDFGVAQPNLHEVVAVFHMNMRRLAGFIAEKKNRNPSCNKIVGIKNPNFAWERLSTDLGERIRRDRERPRKPDNSGHF